MFYIVLFCFVLFCFLVREPESSFATFSPFPLAREGRETSSILGPFILTGERERRCMCVCVCVCVCHRGHPPGCLQGLSLEDIRAGPSHRRTYRVTPFWTEHRGKVFQTLAQHRGPPLQAQETGCLATAWNPGHGLTGEAPSLHSGQTQGHTEPLAPHSACRTLCALKYFHLRTHPGESAGEIW